MQITNSLLKLLLQQTMHIGNQVGKIDLKLSISSGAKSVLTLPIVALLLVESNLNLSCHVSNFNAAFQLFLYLVS